MSVESDLESRFSPRGSGGKDAPSPPAGNGNMPPAATETVARSSLTAQTRYTRILLLGLAYSGVILAAHWLAYLIRFEFHPPEEGKTLFWLAQEWTLPLELAFLFVFGQFRSMLSYFSLPDARRIVYACGGAAVLSMAAWYIFKGHDVQPRSIIILSFLLSTSGLITLRVMFRMLRERQRSNGNSGVALRRMVILGAGDVGANLAKEMKLRRDLGMNPVAFFDDDQAKWNTYVHGVPVLGRPELLANVGIRADEAVIAMPSATGRRIREVVQVLNERRIRFEIVPSMEQMVNGDVKVSQIRPVQIEDLLGRETICLDTGRIRDLVQDKVVMVTGAGGSIGSELCRQIAGQNPLRLLLVERCEVQIFPIEQELLALGCRAEIVPLVADILDGERMHGIFDRYRPNLVFHAAAHKHVPMMEHQPYEAFRNNTIGTKLLAKFSTAFGVERFVLISSDKAINPTNVMGATKRLAELYIQALQQEIRSEKQEARSESGNGTADKVGSRESGKAETEDGEGESGGRGSTRAGIGAVRMDGTGLGDPRLNAQDSRPSISTESKLKLMAVRFGNVLGSSGSVIPTFKKQIAAGGPVTVTHPDITRYFMTIPEAVGLVLQSATQGQGGEIFVLDMGKPVRIVELARQLIELSGLRPGIDIEIEFTGLRPGEKLFEELNHDTENTVPTSHPKIMRFEGEPLPFEVLRRGLVNIREKAANLDANEVKLEIQKLVPEYRPYLTGV
jgi:FlaA1/EpsC-like NDP-sugar epimerase